MSDSLKPTLLMDRDGKVHKFVNKIDAVEAIASKNYFELREDEVKKAETEGPDLFKDHEARSLENGSEEELTIIRSEVGTEDNSSDNSSEDNI